MRRRISVVLGLAMVVAVATQVASDAVAGARKNRSVRVDVPRPQPFADSGEFSGSLDGTITLNGLTYWIAPDAMIYEIGSGVIPVGTVVGGRMVSISGVVDGDTRRIQLVIVRPVADPRAAAMREAPHEAKDRPR